MSAQSFLFLLFLTIIPLLCWLLVPVVWRYRKTAGVTTLAMLLFMVGWWGVVYAAELWVGENLSLKIYLSGVKYIGIVFIPVFWLIFAIEYTQTTRLSNRNRSALLIVPFLSLGILATNRWHELFRSHMRLVIESPLLVTFAADFGPWFWIHTAYSYLLLVVGAILLLRGLHQLRVVYRRQRIVMFMAILLPFLGNIASLLSITPIPNFDLTPLAFSATAVLFAWGFIRLRLMDLAPIARAQVISQSPIGMIVVDLEQRVVDVNRFVTTRFNLKSQEIIGEPFHTGFPALAEALPALDALHEGHQTELAISTANGSYDCLVQVNILSGASGQFWGHIINISDISKLKEIDRAFREKESEAQQLAYVASHTINMVVITDANGLIEWVNDSFVKVTGYAPEEVIGQKPGTILQGEETDQKKVLYMREHIARREAFSCEIVNYSKQGNPYWVNIEVQPVYGETGELTNFIAIETDITKRKFMEENLRQREAEARDSARRQAIVYELLRIISTELDTKTVLNRAVQTIVEQTGWQTAAIFLPSKKSMTLKLAASYPATDASTSQHGFPYMQLYRLAAEAYQTEENVFRPKLPPNEHGTPHKGIISTGQLAVPLRWGIKVTGILTVENERGQPFTAADIALTEAFTDTLIIGLNNATLYEDLDNYLLELSIVHSISQVATESLNVEEVLRETLMVAISSSEFDGGVILLTEQDGEQLAAATLQDPANDLQPLLDNPAFLLELKQYMARGTLSMWSSTDKAQMDQEKHVLYPYWHQAGLVLCLTIPLMQKKSLLGGIVLFCTQKPRKEISTSLFMTAAPQIATAIASTRLHQEIAQKHSQLDTLIDASQDGIILIDTHNVLQVLNGAAHSLLGLTGQPQDWAKRPVKELQDTLLVIAPDLFGAFLDEMRQPLTSKQRFRQGELELAGRFIGWVEVLVIEGDEQIIGRLFVLHDVTEERQLLQMRDDLTNTIVHDMRNPLMGIKAALEMLEFQLEETDEDQKALLELAQESSDNLVALVSSLLDISRLESGRMPLNKQLTSLYDLAEQIINLEKSLAVQKEITLELDISLDLPPAYADRNLLLRVLQNLVGNAIKFTPHNGRVTISGAVQSDGYISMGIYDTGPGIPLTIQESLFQKFTTGHHANSGSGLGLAFCRLVIEAHEGDIWVESELGQGSAFKFTLPPEPE